MKKNILKKFILVLFISLFFSGCDATQVNNTSDELLTYVNGLDIDPKLKDLIVEIIYSTTNFILDPSNQEVITQLTDKSFEIQDKIIKYSEGSNSGTSN